MSKYDIVITLFTIVYGLMLADLFLSLHKLIKAGKNVKLHWLPLLAAWYLFLTILNNWWDLSSFQNSTGWMNIYFFIAYGHLLLLLFLLISTALPDVVEKDGIDLRTYYFNNHRYFWGLMSAVVILSSAINFFKLSFQPGTLDIFLILPANIFFIALLLTLAISKKYWVHTIFLVLLVLGVLFEIIRK